MGAVASRVREGLPGRTASVPGAGGVPSRRRGGGADWWIWVEAPRISAGPRWLSLSKPVADGVSTSLTDDDHGFLNNAVLRGIPGGAC